MERKKLEALVWKHTHADFKGKTDGVKMVLHNEAGVTYGTESWPLSKFTDEQLIEKLPRKVRDAHGLPTKKCPTGYTLDAHAGFLCNCVSRGGVRS